ncbi:hypothetical protein [Pseudarthrobacter sp. BIM B-2242]|uniref:hypothetical protein n=1 Tax=Pseudarthrobacter sp. BIM B-2242 TaxID=2772401 RepID=UPI00168B26A2|nr:hypothetical protein [Pseudarthrobacter sp. BIM B-2242]QOD02619.1 hypothetical protein IDT60_14845 [Pseudarthrobacter sp. BIM B-2242]
MKRLAEAVRRFVAANIVGDDPNPELSRLDQEDIVAHARYVLGWTVHERRPDP